MHHKRHRPKNRRAGCLMCKPNKQNGWNKDRPVVGHRGFGSIKGRWHAQRELEDWQ